LVQVADFAAGDERQRALEVGRCERSLHCENWRAEQLEQGLGGSLDERCVTGNFLAGLTSAERGRLRNRKYLCLSPQALSPDNAKLR
jgi:hypothetical protein